MIKWFGAAIVREGVRKGLIAAAVLCALVPFNNAVAQASSSLLSPSFPLLSCRTIAYLQYQACSEQALDNFVVCLNVDTLEEALDIIQANGLCQELLVDAPSYVRDAYCTAIRLTSGCSAAYTAELNGCRAQAENYIKTHCPWELNQPQGDAPTGDEPPAPPTAPNPDRRQPATSDNPPVNNSEPPVAPDNRASPGGPASPF